MADAAGDGDGLVAVEAEIVELFLEAAGMDVAGAGDVAFLEGAFLADVENGGALPFQALGEFARGGRRQRRDLAPRIAPGGEAARERALDAVEADAGEREAGVERGLRIIGDEPDGIVRAADPAAIDRHAALPDIDGTGNVAAGEGLDVARVDDDAVGAAACEVLRREPGERAAVERTAGMEIDLLHQPEIWRARHPLRQLVADEAVAGQAAGGVRLALDAERGPFAVGDIAAAGRARPMRGQYQRLIAEGKDLLVEAVVKLARMLAGLFRVGEIGAAGVAHEERIAREDGPDGVRRLVEGDGEAHAFRRVARHMERAEGDAAAEAEGVAVLQRLVGMGHDLVIAGGDFRARDGAQRRAAHLEILLAVRLQHVAQRQAIPSQNAEIAFDIAGGVDEGGGAAATQDVGEMGDARRFDTLEKHGASCCAGLRETRSGGGGSSGDAGMAGLRERGFLHAEAQRRREEDWSRPRVRACAQPEGRLRREGERRGWPEQVGP